MLTITDTHGPGTRPTARAAVVVGALGVVFGDIGTSPIYTVQTVFNPSDPHPVPVNLDNVYGIISLIFWSVTIIVTLTYVTLITRADNDGEGGIMALITLISRKGAPGGRRAAMVLAALGIFGASLFFGDSMITPAISVLSAVEGLKVVEPSLESLIVPITAVIIIVLFSAQRVGTAAVGRLFGPVMIIWFLAIGACGVVGIVGHPEILWALSPTYAVGFLVGHFSIAFFALAAVVLAVTGAEALYADMGHFGRPAITRAWLILVFPACVLSYLGQGALVLDDPVGNIGSPFFLLVPGWGRLPMVLLATAATVIASQAVITGAFSVASQAAQLGYLPRLRIRHTSAESRGADLRAVDQLDADDLGAHPGVRVRVLGRAGVRLRHGGDGHDHHHHAAVLLRGVAALAGAAVAGGPGRGRAAADRPAVPGREPDQAGARGVVAAADRRHRVHGDDHLATRPGARHPPARAGRGLAAGVHHRAARPAATAAAGGGHRGVPQPRQGDGAAGHAVQRRALPGAARARRDHVDRDPAGARVPVADRLVIDDLGYTDDGITHVSARFGYMDPPNVPDVVRLLESAEIECPIEVDTASYFVSTIELRRGTAPTMAQWRKRLFLATSAITADAAEYFNLPRDRTLIIGSQVEV